MAANEEEVIWTESNAKERFEIYNIEPKCFPGLNYFGHCKRCKQYVIFPRKIPEKSDTPIRFNEDMAREEIFCSGCHTVFDLGAFVFYRCKAEVVYRFQGEGINSQKEIDTRELEGNCLITTGAIFSPNVVIVFELFNIYIKEVF